MKITHLECWPQVMSLRRPYTISYETISTAPNVFLRLTTNTGLSGYGCAAPDLEITGETIETVLDFFSKAIEPILKNSDPFRFIFLIEKLKKISMDHPSAMAMVDMALYDLVARHAKVPLYKYLGGFRKEIPTSVTIGILPLQETLEEARELVAKGFRIIKIKGGANCESDIERIIKTREVVGNKVTIRFDANQGYSVDEAIDFIARTKTAKIEIFEQPTSRRNEDLLGIVTSKVPIPVMADESLMTLLDVFRLTRNDVVDMINIKLMKVGGINEALHINSVAKSAGVEAMVGCMDESALGIAAGLHFTLSRPNVIYADLDGHLDLLDDPFAGLVEIKKGVLYPDSGIGLGIIDIA